MVNIVIAICFGLALGLSLLAFIGAVEGAARLNNAIRRWER